MILGTDGRRLVLACVFAGAAYLAVDISGSGFPFFSSHVSPSSRTTTTTPTQRTYSLSDIQIAATTILISMNKVLQRKHVFPIHQNMFYNIPSSAFLARGNFDSECILHRDIKPTSRSHSTVIGIPLSLLSNLRFSISLSPHHACFVCNCECDGRSQPRDVNWMLLET